ncbi:zinc-finger domain of monoamine-oxidase A repressor R1 [Artemisia annua]|uniref:Zinc-finger domain of monoamine-oxidase A repressor R1 n=1 Tax=Artemisia annua TaxID=35608 RepID=A0A2U1Q872_ARTAN|nr:zinc-finger domain of monoamine-oxidase A repressor R1 [Artemisia annua]
MVTMTDQSPQEMKSCDYEKCREERIKENLERMQKLGIHDLSLKLKSIKPNHNNNRKRRNYNQDNKTPKCVSPLMSSSVPTRRSSRLQSTPAVSYAEVPVPKKGKDGRDISMAENSRPEVYTEEHEKMLGEAKTEWTLFVDGCGKDGKRIYDQVRGKTCHQCRQKTMGHRTHCIQCNMVQGQFCGDCLYMRYGENVLEAKQNPDWICPVCRGICNCSLCRQAKGWAATGAMYRKITSLGYKSVAHYLIQTRRADPNSEKNEKTGTQTKRSLTFSSDEVKPEDGVAKSDNMKSEDGIATNKVNKDEKPTELQIANEPLCDNEKLESDQEMKNKKPEAHAGGREGEDENKNKGIESEEILSEVGVTQNEEIVDLKNKNLEPEEIDSEGLVDEGEVKNKNEVKKSEVHKEFTNSENKVKNPNHEVKSSIVTPLVTKAGSRKKRCAVPLENSIAGRLRSRRKCT